MASGKLTNTTKSSKVESKSKIRNTREVQQNITFGLLLIGLLVGGFSFGAIIGMVDDSTQSQTTTYTREAKAYNDPQIQTIQPIQTQQNQSKLQPGNSSDSAQYSIQVLPSNPAR